MITQKGHDVKILVGHYQPHGGTKITLDGMELQEVLDIQFEHKATEVAKLTITFYPRQVEIAGRIFNVDMSRPQPDITDLLKAGVE